MEGEVRENLVSQGLGFLRAQTSSSLGERVQFLEGKGLSSAEVTEALARWRNIKGTTPSKPPTSLLQWLMSNVVGPLAVVATGLLVYNLSGGEEEFPQRPIEQDVLHQEQAPSGGQLVAGCDLVQVGVASGGSSLLLFPQEEDPPEWAKELHKLTVSLTEEMQLVRTKLDRLIAINESGRSVADDETASSAAQQPDPEPPVTIECRLMNIREALCAMQEASKSSVDPDAIKKCCGALVMYVTMLLEHPDTPRYRKIAVSNDSFKSNVQPVEGHEKVLESIGFERRGLYYEWTWIQSPPSQAGASSSSSTGVSTVDKESREQLLKWFIANLEKLKQGAELEQAPTPPQGESDTTTEDSRVAMVATSEDSGLIIPSFAEIAAQAKQGSDSVSVTSPESQGEK